ncbi:MAG: aldo/keto reductase [Betaproteobacteria bacterium]|nr:aldo/keto reductase [Betaproteobacteria bacterium]
MRASVAGLGGGGFSRLGLNTGKTESDAIALVREALDLGVNLIDTAPAYGTEAVIGRAISNSPRDKIILCTKTAIHRRDTFIPAKEVISSLEDSLRTLGTDYVDVFMLHAVPASAYAHARDVIAPALLREKEKGKLRHLGLTETSPNDHQHRMLAMALPDGPWEVAMLGFNMLHQNAKQILFPLTNKRGVGTLLMFTVRSIFSQPERMRAAMQDLGARGQLAKSIADSPDPLGFLVHAAGASSLTDAAYRYVRHTAGVDVVLFGTSDPAHLRANIASLEKGPLPAADLEKISALFGHLVGVGLDAPSHNPGATA